MFPAWNLSFIYRLLKVKWVLLIGQGVITLSRIWYFLQFKLSIWLLAKTIEFLKLLLVFMFLLSNSNRLVNNYRKCFWMHLFCFQKIEVWHGLVIIMFVIDYIVYYYCFIFFYFQKHLNWHWTIISTACYTIYWKWSDEVIIFLHLIQFRVSHFLESICAHIFISSVTPNCFLRTLTSQQQIIFQTKSVNINVIVNHVATKCYM
jgi:uncharacterized membrane protein